MAFATAHFALGMACGGAIGAMICLTRRRPRSWRPVGLGMTLGGFWACVPDMPRIWRDYPSLPGSAILGSHDTESLLHRAGDLFFFHRTLDAQPHEYAVAGFAAVVLLYNLVICLTMFRRRHAGLHADGLPHGP